MTEEKQDPAVSGHRLAPHTADCIVEAWGPDRVTCMAEAMRAMVEVFAQPTGESAGHPVELSARGDTDSELLVSLLEEVIYSVDALAAIPIAFDLREVGPDEISGSMSVVAPGAVRLVGPVPKAVSYHGLECGPRGGTWRCRAVVDV